MLKIAVRTVRWQCSGCDHLCALLTDELIRPEEIIKCKNGQWRKITKETHEKD